jgi:hypothetical protein
MAGAKLALLFAFRCQRLNFGAKPSSARSEGNGVVMLTRCLPKPIYREVIFG